MQIYISFFGTIRYFTPNMIPVSTAGGCGWPWWLLKADKHKEGEFYLNKNNIMIGIQEESLSFPREQFEQLTEPCQKDCPYKDKVPNCQFMTAYYNYLKTLDFKHIISEFERIAEDVQKINNYIGESIIVLMVYEGTECNCAERPVLQKWFKDNGYELKEWTKDLVIDDCIF